MLATDQNGNETEIKVCLRSGGKPVEICAENAETIAQIMAKDTDEHVEAMRATFNQHCNKQNWKLPFKAFVPTKEEAMLLADAIDFMLADTASVSRIAGGYMVSTRGYMAW